MTTVLAESLRTLEQCHHRLGRFALLDALNPGIDATMVRAHLADHGLSSRPDLEVLYAWHNGTGGSETLLLEDLWLFPISVFQPLQEMLGIYEQLMSSGYWNPDWFPIFMDTAGDFYVVDLGAPDNGAIRNIRNDYLDQPIIEYSSLAAMMETIVAAYDAEALFIDDAGILSKNADDFARIAAKLNPEVAWWNGSAFA